jgi:hypothetical protein
MKKQLEQLLKFELIGTDIGFCNSDILFRIIKIVRQFFSDKGLDATHISYRNHKDSKNSITLTYKNIGFGEVIFKKKKGKYNSSYFGKGHYDWTCSKITLNFFNENEYSCFPGLTFDEMIENIEQQIIEQKNNENAKKLRAKEAFKLLKETFNLNDYETRDFIKYIDNNRYSL